MKCPKCGSDFPMAQNYEQWVQGIKICRKCGSEEKVKKLRPEQHPWHTEEKVKP